MALTTSLSREKTAEIGFQLLNVRHLLGRFLLVLAIVVMVATLGGCRYSEALYEIKTDQLNGQYEPDAEPEYKDVDGAPEDPTKASTHLSNTDNKTEQTNVLPIYGDVANVDAANNAIHDETTNDDITASEGNEVSEEEGSAATGEEEKESGEGADGEGKGTDKSDEKGDPTPDKTAGRGGKGQTYGDGSYDELPEARAIAARGSYALITQMLGGQGALAATDNQFKKDVEAAKAFPGEGVDKIPALWKGKSSKLDIDKLIKDTTADVVLVDGVECTLTEKEVKSLKAGGIDIVNVPALGLSDTSDKDIVSAVKVVGQVLAGKSSKTKYDTAEMVDTWINIHDAAIAACVDANNGYSYKLVDGAPFMGIYQGNKATGDPTNNISDNRMFTAFVDKIVAASAPTAIAQRSWGDIQFYRHGQTIDLRDGVGVSVRVNDGNFALMDYYLQTAGVLNNAYESARPTTVTSTGLTLPYAVILGEAGEILVSSGSRIRNSALSLSVYGADDWTLVGDADFPGLLVRDEDVANAIVKSASKVNGLYNVGQSYSVRVVPEGIAGSWADGTTESFLLAPWALCVFQSGSISDCKDWIDQYYACFYRIDNATSKGAVKDLDTSKIASGPTS